jgi:hypothetical protein
MIRVEAILAVAMALSLSGCVLPGKPRTANATPAPPRPVSLPTHEPPPAQLSVPQTKAELPPPQPLSADAVASTQPLDEAPSTPAPRNNKPAKPRAPAVAPRAETVGPAAAQTLPAPPPAESRPPIQEIVPAAELNRLQAEAEKSKREIRQRLEQARKHRLSPQEQDLREQVLSFVKQSDQAQARGDMRKACDLAVRGLVLAKELVDGR